MTGAFITFEGGDGAGKSTQLTALVNTLTAAGQAPIVTREPGGTDVGRAIRQIVLEHTGFVDPKAEALLYAADRAQHIAEIVRPALDAGRIVVQDRYIDSSIAYQGAGRNLGADIIVDISMWASGNLWPDVTVLLDIDPDVAIARTARLTDAPDRIESAGTEFRRKLRAGFLDLAAKNPDRFLVIDATLPRGVQANRIAARVREVIASKAAAA